MKHKGNTMDFARQRRDELLCHYRRMAANLSVINIIDIAHRLANLPASRFWISEDRAAAVLRAMFAGRHIPPMLPSRRKMFDEIFRRASAIRQIDPSRSVIDIARDIVYQPAPSFYLQPKSIADILYDSLAISKKNRASVCQKSTI